MSKVGDPTVQLAAPSCAASTSSSSDDDEDSTYCQYRFETDWCLGSISPDPNHIRGYSPGTKFTVFCASILPDLRKPLAFSLQLRCQVEIYTARLGHRFGEPEPPDWDRCDDKHELLLDSLQLDVDTREGDPVARNEVQYGKYHIPDRGRCACETGETQRWLPSSCEDGPVVVRYWFDLTAQTVPDGKTRSGWKGKLASIGNKQYSLRIPVRIAATKAARPILPPDSLSASLDVRDLSRFEREDELHTIRSYLEKGPRPLLAENLPCPTLRLVHRVKTTHISTASISFRLEASAGVHFGNDLVQTEQTLADLTLATDFRLVRRTTIVLPVSSTAAVSNAGKGKGKAKALPYGVSLRPLVDEVMIGRVRIDRHHSRREMRLVGSADEPGVRAHELFLVFEGELVLQPSDFVQGLPRPKGLEKFDSPSSPPIRVETCHAEVRYDLVAELGLTSRNPLCQVRACDVRVDLPGAPLEPDSGESDIDFDDNEDSDGSESQSASSPRKSRLSTSAAAEIDADRFPALYRTGSPMHAVASPVESDQNSALPPYEPQSSSTAPTSRRKKHLSAAACAVLLDVSHSLPRAVIPDTAAPPSYQSAQQSPAEPAASLSSSRGRLSRIFSSRGTIDPPSAAPVPASIRATATLQPTASPLPTVEPPSWNDTVRADIAVDWAVASLALEGDAPPSGKQDSRGPGEPVSL